MFTMLMVLGVLWPAQPAQALHCRIDLAAGTKSARCQVTAPAGRAIRRCGDVDRRAGHCTAVGRGGDRVHYVAWVVQHGPGRCRITDKKTKWGRGVVSAKLSKTGGAASSCDLVVEVQ